MNAEIAKITPEIIAIVGSAAENGLAPFSREIFLLDIVVAGTTYCEKIYEIEPYLIDDLTLTMTRITDNDYDENAIAIYYQNTRIGWIPQELNLIISRLMDAGKAFFCRVQNTSRINDWVKIKAKIYMVE